MTKKALLLFLLLAAWTAATYAGLAWLMSLAIDPQTYEQSSEPDYRQHGLPIIGVRNSLIWLGFIAAYAAGVAWLTAQRFPIARSQAPYLAVIVFSATCLYLAVVHPSFLAVALPNTLWAPYRDFVRDHIEFLDNIYGRWALPRLKYHVLAGQVVLTACICSWVVAAAELKARRFAR